MKRYIIIFLIFSISASLSWAQNPFTQRSKKSTNNIKPSFKYSTLQSISTTTSSHGFILDKVDFNLVQEIEVKKPVQRLRRVEGSLPLGKATANPEEAALNFLIESIPSLAVMQNRGVLIHASTKKDELGIQHLRFTRKLDGFEVYNGEILVKIYPDGRIQSLGNFAEGLPNKEIKVAVTKAKSIALTALGSVWQAPMDHSNWEFSEKRGMESKLVWFESEPNMLIKAYQIDYFPNYIDRYRLVIDANSGEILRSFNRTCKANGPKTATAKDLNNQNKTINTYEVNGVTYLIDASRPMFEASRSSLPSSPIGAIVTYDARNTNAQGDLFYVSSNNNTWTDKAAVSAHHHASLAYEYFRTTHGRNSINGSGGTIISIVNVTDDNGSGLDNAYWNGKAMFYGNGGGAFTPLAGSADVAGHEMTHGVVSSTANLEYYSQSGAINESMADVFGAMIDRDDWKLGEDVVKTSSFPSGALRDLSNPHNGGNRLGDRGFQPEKMSEYYTGDQDNQGVHINSGIPNKAYYLIATAIGKSKAEKIYYRALDNYLTSNSNFLDLRYAVIDAAKDLHGNNSNEEKEIKKAFDAVEIYDPNGDDGGGNDDEEHNLPENAGAEHVLSIDVDPFNSNTLYQSTTAGTNFKDLSTTDFKRKPSVTDDGSFCVFVADDDKIHRINLTGTQAETVIQSEPIWSNVAISKDGKRLAAITKEIDSSIYVYDFESSKWFRYRLYNPTFTDGVTSAGVVYADAIEFDYSGEHILYDARNVLSNNGQTQDYWDIGIIKVWDNDKNNWGDGKVEKLFSQLPDDISIGNPTYSKNSPHIIAFDYIDEFKNEYAIIGFNSSTGVNKSMFGNVGLGYPNYSTSDDKMIFDAETQSGDEVIAIIDLDASKIEGKGDASILISDAKWGVWYAEGKRKLLSDKKDLLSFSFPGVLDHPKGVFLGNKVNVQLPIGTDLSSLVPTFTHSQLSEVWVGSQEQTSGASNQNYSSGRVDYIVQAEDGTEKTYQVLVEVDQPVSVSKSQLNPTLVYPNPSKGLVTLIGNNAKNILEIYNIQGVLVGTYLNNPSTLDLMHLNAGLYTFRFKSMEGEKVLKWIKID